MQPYPLRSLKCKLALWCISIKILTIYMKIILTGFLTAWLDFFTAVLDRVAQNFNIIMDFRIMLSFFSLLSNILNKFSLNLLTFYFIPLKGFKFCRILVIIMRYWFKIVTAHTGAALEQIGSVFLASYLLKVNFNRPDAYKHWGFHSSDLHTAPLK